MLDWNAGIYISAQFGSRFVNSFLTTAVRYELLEKGGVAKFASAQVANQVARVFMQQIAGVLTDNYSLKKLYVLGETFNVVLVIVMLLSAQATSALFIVNIALGLSQAFSQPVAKSLPPSVTAPENLAVVNSWDLTGDKIGRNLAPMVYTVLSSSMGFSAAAILSFVLCVCLVVLKQLLSVMDAPAKEDDHKPGRRANGSSLFRRLFSVFSQVGNGILSLKSDRTIALLIMNTLVTNALIYPLSSVVFPVIFKAIPEGAIEEEGSMTSRFILSLQGLMGIQKKKAWMNYAALVSLGGVIGPFISNAVVYQINAWVATHPKQVNWVGLNCGLCGQIVTTLPLVGLLMFMQSITAGMRVCLLFVVWGAMTALNNVTTIYFNAHSQQRLLRSERGKFIANILTLFSVANSIGSLLYGSVLSSGTLETQIATSSHVIGAAVMLRIIFLVLLHSNEAGKRTVLLKNVD